MFTRAGPRKEKGKSSERHFRPLTARWRVGHVLVLVFAATRRHLALRAARVIEHAASAMLLFFEMRFVKASYTV